MSEEDKIFKSKLRRKVWKKDSQVTKAVKDVYKSLRDLEKIVKKKYGKYIYNIGDVDSYFVCKVLNDIENILEPKPLQEMDEFTKRAYDRLQYGREQWLEAFGDKNV